MGGKKEKENAKKEKNSKIHARIFIILKKPTYPPLWNFEKKGIRITIRGRLKNSPIHQIMIFCEKIMIFPTHPKNEIDGKNRKKPKFEKGGKRKMVRRCLKLFFQKRIFLLFRNYLVGILCGNWGLEGGGMGVVPDTPIYLYLRATSLLMPKNFWIRRAQFEAFL